MAKRFVKYETENPVGVDAEGVLTGGGSGGLTVLKLSEIATLEPGKINAGGMMTSVLFVNVKVETLPDGNYIIVYDIDTSGDYEEIRYRAILSDGNIVKHYTSGEDYIINSLIEGNLNVHKWSSGNNIDMYFGSFNGYDYIWCRKDDENPWKAHYARYTLTDE